MPPKPKFEAFKEFAKDVGEKGSAALGNPEAKFNQRVKEKMKHERKTERAAQGECLKDLANALRMESGYGIVEKKSKGFKEFQGALKTLLSREKIKQCKKDSESGFFTPPTGVSVNADNITNQRQYFEHKFKNYGGSYVPNDKILRRHAQQSKTIDALLERLTSSGSINIADLKAGKNAESADIGKILELKKNMDYSESTHEFRIGGTKIMRTMWESAKTDITKHIFGDLKGIFDGIFYGIADILEKGIKARPDFAGIIFSSAKLAIDVTLLLPKAVAKGALNSFTFRPNKVY